MVGLLWFACSRSQIFVLLVILIKDYNVTHIEKNNDVHG